MTNKPAAIDINLVPKDPFYETTLGRVLKWALSAGRYIVIFTELVVIMSFATRFTLDRQLTDLNSEILIKQSITESYGDLESSFRTAQSKIQEYTKLTSQEPLLENFVYISEVTPDGVELDEMVINNSGITASGTTTSQASFNLFVNNLQISPHFINVSLDSVESPSDGESGLAFKLRAVTREVKRVPNPTEASSPTGTQPLSPSTNVIEGAPVQGSGT